MLGISGSNSHYLVILRLIDNPTKNYFDHFDLLIFFYTCSCVYNNISVLLGCLLLVIKFGFFAFEYGFACFFICTLSPGLALHTDFQFLAKNHSCALNENYLINSHRRNTRCRPAKLGNFRINHRRSCSLASLTLYRLLFSLFYCCSFVLVA